MSNRNRKAGTLSMDEFNKIHDLHGYSLKHKQIAEVTGWSLATVGSVIKYPSYSEYRQYVEAFTTKQRAKRSASSPEVKPELVIPDKVELDQATTEMFHAFDTTLAGINDKLDEVVDILQGIRSETTKRGFWQ